MDGLILAITFTYTIWFLNAWMFFYLILKFYYRLHPQYIVKRGVRIIVAGIPAILVTAILYAVVDSMYYSSFMITMWVFLGLLLANIIFRSNKI
jgi:hypothetical protein